MQNNKKFPTPKNPLQVDLEFFGKLNTPKHADAFFRKAGENQESQSVEALREIYDETLTGKNFVRIEDKVQKFLDKIRNADNSGYLRHLMNMLVSDGIIVAEKNERGRRIYRKHPQIERTHDLLKAYHDRKGELSKAYDEIMSKPNGVRIEGKRKRHPKDRNPMSYAYVCSLEFSTNKHSQPTVRIDKVLPIHGSTPRVPRNAYIIGYTVPGWLKGPVKTALSQIEAAEKKANESKPVELEVVKDTKKEAAA